MAGLLYCNFKTVLCIFSTCYLNLYQWNKIKKILLTIDAFKFIQITKHLYIFTNFYKISKIIKTKCPYTHPRPDSLRTILYVSLSTSWFLPTWRLSRLTVWCVWTLIFLVVLSALHVLLFEMETVLTEINIRLFIC